MIDRALRLMLWSDTYWPNIGGIEVLSEQLVQNLVARGVEVVVVTSNQTDVSRDIEMHRGAAVHRFPFRDALSGARSDLWKSIIQDVSALKSRFRPDIVHVNVPAPSTIFHMLTMKSSDAKTVTAVHTDFPRSAKGSDSLTRRMLLAGAWTTANSYAMLTAARSIAPEIISRSSVIYNGLQRPDTKPSRLSVEPPVIVCVARLVHKKGVDVALRAFAVVRRTCPDARLIIAGDGPERQNLRVLSAELALEDAVEFRGWVEPAAIAAVMNEASQTWVPSRQTEPFGNVAVEAMQMGRPVIVTDMGGLPEVVEDGVSGIVIPADDPAALAAASLALLEGFARAEAMGIAGRTRAEKMFSIERYADDHEQLYRHLSAEHK
jgi:glycosyltransferase involved in cell wall biosynthesis